MEEKLIELRNECNHLRDEKLIKLINIIIESLKPIQENAFEQMQPKDNDGQPSV